MDWHVLLRRCPSRSITAVGDLAQRSAAGLPRRGPTSSNAPRGAVDAPDADGELPDADRDHDPGRGGARQVPWTHPTHVSVRATGVHPIEHGARASPSALQAAVDEEQERVGQGAMSP
ncbi:hypothetical protein HBB16_07110 [Pseudonocardia sp. MCCB 268]|nr:hypothetical protein [Pseudonocardia cytotoxica]